MSVIGTRIGLQVAIDGPAGAGKSTVARAVAERLGLTYVDTGAMYRALAWAATAQNIALTDMAAVCRLAESLEIRLERGRVYADGQEVTTQIRTSEISNLTSALSALPCVRERLSALQREMGHRGGVVMEGRDIGTVVLPEAQVKVFLTASGTERVRRRQAELHAKGIVLDEKALSADMAERDARDAARETAPMVAAADAVHLETDGLDADAVTARIVALCREVEARYGS